MVPLLTIGIRDYARQRRGINESSELLVYRRFAYFFPIYKGSVLVALTYIPSYTTPLDCATVLAQKGGDTIRKFFTVPRVTFDRVSEIGRPSPSALAWTAKYDHHGYRRP